LAAAAMVNLFSFFVLHAKKVEITKKTTGQILRTGQNSAIGNWLIFVTDKFINVIAKLPIYRRIIRIGVKLLIFSMIPLVQLANHLLVP
jgi:hypothetical protein